MGADINGDSAVGSAGNPRIEALVTRLQLARRVTNQFLDDLKPDEWFWSPPQYPTHIAWQTLHISAAQYALCFRRIRGTLPEDDQWCPAEYLKRFGLGSEPQLDPAANPASEDIRRVFDGVYERAVTAIPGYDVEALEQPVDPPHPAFATKWGSLEFAPQHEAIHAGQMAMLRRLMGKKPLR